MKFRLNIAILVGAVFGAFLAIGLPAVASAHVPTVVPGASCDHVGDKGTHNGDDYVCEIRKGEKCPSWRHVPQPGASTTWTHQPCPCESTSPTASPSHTPTPTASPSGSATVVITPSPSTPPTKVGSATPSSAPVVAGGPTSMPVTGSRSADIAGAGVASIGAGALFLTAGLVYRRRRTESPS